MRMLMRCACLALGLLAVSCAMPGKNICEPFERESKAYNKMLRWHEIEAAGMAHLGRELRESYLKDAAGLKKRGVTITDYRILTTECLADRNSGEMLVEFEYYVLPSNRIRTQPYRQKWEHSDSDGWRLKSGLPAFE